MNIFYKEKKKYEQIEIPKELNEIVSQAVASSGRHKRNYPSRSSIVRLISIAAAAVLVIFTIGLNTSESLAKELGSVPILGGLVKILTFRSYEEQKENVNISVQIPEIVTDESVNEPNIITDINAEIDKYMSDYVTDAQTRLEEYKTAFLETGGTEEEWNSRNFEVKADYKITCQNEDYLSFVISGVENWTSAYAVTYFYNINLNTGKETTLKELLGEDYINIANANILNQIQQRIQENPDYTYFDEDMGGFQTITDTARFYINENGNPVITFEKYEIAPGFMGPQEFEIPLPETIG